MRNTKLSVVAAAVIAASGLANAQVPDAFVQTNLVANNASYNPQIVNPDFSDAWGIALRPPGAGGHIWVNNAFNGDSDEYIGDVNGIPLHQDPLTTVSLDAPAFTDRGQPFDTGLVYNASSDFTGQAEEFPVSGPSRNAANGVASNYNGSSKFIFCTEDGVINAWSANTANAMDSAPIILDYSKSSGSPGNPNFTQLGDTLNPVFSGLAITTKAVTAAQVGTAQGNRNNNINVFDDQWKNVTSSFQFQTPANLTGSDLVNSSTYNPLNTFNLHIFNIQDLNGDLYATYAQFNDAGDEGFEEKDRDKSGSTPGQYGAIVEYSETGQFIKEFTDAPDVPDQLDAPWGLAIAPAGWGPFGGDLLATNFGDDGTISVFDPNTGDYIGKLDDTSGNPISINGIWGLTFGNGVSLGDTNSLYFTAGPNSEFDGLLGKITVAPVPEPASLGLIGFGGIALLGRRRRI
jgi:uncharacterized protein (TIGR03118 family)